MITNPKNLTEQLMNLAERLAIEMRVLFNTIKIKLNKSEFLENWETLRSLAFKDTVSFTSGIDKLDYDPKEFFDAEYHK